MSTKWTYDDFPEVQWLGLCAFTAEGSVQSLVEDPTNHGAQPKAKHKTEYLLLELGIRD